MRFAWLLAVALAGGALHTQAAQTYSKEYTQCMNFTYGQQSKTEKCLKKELKLQKKVLKKSYQNYLKMNPSNASLTKTQITMFERRLNQQCGRIQAGKLTKVQRGQCQLDMMVQQSNWFQSRLFGSARR